MEPKNNDVRRQTFGPPVLEFWYTITLRKLVIFRLVSTTDHYGTFLEGNLPLFRYSGVLKKNAVELSYSECICLNKFISKMSI